MYELEFKARQEFARILTKAMHSVNTLLDGRSWGSVSPGQFSVERFGKNYVRLDYQGMGISASMHASDDPVFGQATARVWGAPLTEKEELAYVLVVREST